MTRDAPLGGKPAPESLPESCRVDPYLVFYVNLIRLTSRRSKWSGGHLHIDIIHRAGHLVDPLQVQIGQFAVAPGHVQGAVSQQSLQGEGVPSLTQVAHRCGVPQGMGRAADPFDMGLLAIAPEDAPHTVLGQGKAVPGEEQPVLFQPGRGRTVAADVAHQVLAHLAAHRYQAFLVAFAQHLELGFIQGHVGQLQSDELGDPQPGIQEGQDDDIIPVSLRRGGVDDRQQLLDLAGGERGNDLLGRARQLHPVEGSLLQESFGYQPGEEGPDAAQVGVDGVTGQAPILGWGPGMVGKAGLLPQVEDEGPDLLGGNAVHLGGGPEIHQEVLQVGDAGEDNIDGFGAFPLGGGTEIIVLFEALQIGGRFVEASAPYIYKWPKIV